MRVLATTGDGTATPVEAPMPVQGSREVLVRVEAATINYADRFIASGAVHQLGLITHDGAVGLGWDAVGRVESVGPDVRTVLVGDRVAGVRVADDTIYGVIDALMSCCLRLTSRSCPTLSPRPRQHQSA